MNRFAELNKNAFRTPRNNILAEMNAPHFSSYSFLRELEDTLLGSINLIIIGTEERKWIATLRCIQNDLVQLFALSNVPAAVYDSVIHRTPFPTPPTPNRLISAPHASPIITHPKRDAFFKPEPPQAPTFQERLEKSEFDVDSDEIPRQYLDSITKDIMENPVIVNDQGDCLDRQSYQDLIAQNIFVHPDTRRALYRSTDHKVIPNSALKSLIIDFVEYIENRSLKNPQAVASPRSLFDPTI